MKVLTVSHLFPNAAKPLNGVFVRELTLALARNPAVEATRVLAPISHFPWLRPVRGVPETETMGGVPVSHPRYLALPGRLFNFRWLPYYLATRGDGGRSGFSPHIIHSHWLYPDAYAAARWKTAGRPKRIATVHGHATLGKGLLGVPSPKNRLALHSQDHIITVSEPLKDLITGEFGVPEERVSVIHNGIDPEKFTPRSQSDARAKLGLADGPIALCVARLSAEKQLDLLIESVRRCRVPGLRLYLLGEGPLRSELESRIARSRLGSCIHLMGGVPHAELADWFFAADVFCLSSAHEGCPVVVHEALGCGLPVISTPVGAVPDLIHSPHLGLLSAADPEAYGTALETAFQSSWDRESIRAEGLTHTWDAVARKTVSLYEQLMSEG